MRWGTLPNEHIYILYKPGAVAIDLANKDKCKLFVCCDYSCEILT